MLLLLLRLVAAHNLYQLKLKLVRSNPRSWSELLLLLHAFDACGARETHKKNSYKSIWWQCDAINFVRLECVHRTLSLTNIFNQAILIANRLTITHTIQWRQHHTAAYTIHILQHRYISRASKFVPNSWDVFAMLAGLGRKERICDCFTARNRACVTTTRKSTIVLYRRVYLLALCDDSSSTRVIALHDWYFPYLSMLIIYAFFSSLCEITRDPFFIS